MGTLFLILTVLLIISFLLLKYSAFTDEGYVYEDSKFLKEYLKEKVEKEVLVEEIILD